MRVSFPRRQFLHGVSAGMAIASLPHKSGIASQAAAEPMIIDCHAHIYGTDEKRYPTIEKPYRPPPGKGTLRHLRAEMKAAGVRYVTAIQTSTYYRWDNRFTSDSSRLNPDYMVGVVTLDPDDPTSDASARLFHETRHLLT